MDDRKVTEEEIAEFELSLQDDALYQSVKFATKMLLIKLCSKEIEGFPNYWISTTGEVNHIHYDTCEINTLKPRVHRGHLEVGLYKDGKQFKKYVHVLVAEAFVKKPPELIGKENLVVHHIDANPANNTDTNLCWMTNADHTRLHKSKKVYCIDTDEFFASATDAAKAYGLHRSNVSAVCSGKRLSTGGYHFCFVEEDK